MSQWQDEDGMAGADPIENVLEAVAAVTACVAGATLLIRWLRKQPASARRAVAVSEARQRARAR